MEGAPPEGEGKGVVFPVTLYPAQWRTSGRKQGWRSNMAEILLLTTPFSQRAEFLAVVVSKTPPKHRDGGSGGVPPGSGFEGAGAPRQPQCMTLGRLAPLYYALRHRPRCPPLATGSAPGSAPSSSGERDRMAGPDPRR